MAAAVAINNSTNFGAPPLLTNPSIQAPFQAVRQLFDHLRANPAAAAALNATYPKRGIYKTAATHNARADQKLTVDLWPGRDEHRRNPRLAASATTTRRRGPEDAANGLRQRTPDYGTFSVIFPERCGGRRPGARGTRSSDPRRARITALRHRVRRVPGVRRLSAVLFVASDLDVALRLVEGVAPVRRFSEKVMGGGVDVDWFKEVMGKRSREGNGEVVGGEEMMAQDEDIRRLVVYE